MCKRSGVQKAFFYWSGWWVVGNRRLGLAEYQRGAGKEPMKVEVKQNSLPENIVVDGKLFVLNSFGIYVLA